MNNKPVFQTSNLSFAFGASPVLRNLTFELNAGKVYGIVGPNGSGKTTLIDLLVAVKKPTSGQIAFKGRPISSYSRKKLARGISLVPQDFSISFPFTVFEAVLMGRHPYMPRFSRPTEEDIALVEEAMKEIGVSGLRNKHVTDLSGGEKQRVVLARALAQYADVIVLDEPTSNLDIQHALHILSAIKERVQQHGGTAITVMHDLNLAAAHCDELLFLKNGRVHAFGKTEDVLTETNIKDVFNVEARTTRNELSDAITVMFRYGKQKL